MIVSVGRMMRKGGGGLIWPKGLKESIKAIYDPAKQGMTNYDVIEAYTEDFTTWTVNKEGVIANVTSKSITITNVLNSNPLIYAYGTFSVRLRIDGLKNGQGIFFGDNKEYTISENGIYDIDTTENIRTNFIGECNITITQIPDYPDQLCYDGKMYAVAYDMPILTDYTVMADRTWFEKEEYSAFISNSLGGMENPSNGAFSVEVKSLNSFTTISFGSITSIGIPEKGITYQTKQSYNGNSINVGTKESNDILILGGRYFYKNDNAAGNTWTGCHGAIIVADRSFRRNKLAKG